MLEMKYTGGIRLITSAFLNLAMRHSLIGMGGGEITKNRGEEVD